jgi:hypothetical protein
MTASASPDRTILLEGSETVQRDGNLILVNTYQWTCSNTTAAASCVATSIPYQVTRAGVDPVIPVQNGDEVQVTVELSFN